MAKVEKLLDPDRAAPLVRAYYDRTSPFPFSGARFETLARGGHRADAADEITYDDIVAVSLLGVDIPGWAALRLLVDDAKPIGAQLRALPRLQRLATVDIEELLDPDQPAMQLWTLLTSIPKVGPTKASKLLARKRPHLIPIWDDVVSQFFDPKVSHWQQVHTIVNEHAHTLATIRREAGVPSNISLLRVLDVTLWMRGKGAAQLRAATGIDLLAAPVSKKPKKARKSKKG